MKVNLVIATYAGKYFKYLNNSDKDNYLKLNLLILNQIKTDVSQITIMKPKILDGHIPIDNYYNFDNIDINNIRDKIKIHECDNIGISYGQFFNAIKQYPDFDYYIFTEDDYVPFVDYFEEKIIDEYNKGNSNTYMCSYYNKSLGWNINLLKDHKGLLEKFNNTDINCIIPDFSLGVLSKYCVDKIIDKFGSLNNVLDILDISVNLKCMWHYQILFGFIINYAGIDVNDTSVKYQNMFFESSRKEIQILNNSNNNLELPLFVPIDIFYYNYSFDTLTIGLKDQEEFILKFNLYMEYKKYI